MSWKWMNLYIVLLILFCMQSPVLQTVQVAACTRGLIHSRCPVPRAVEVLYSVATDNAIQIQHFRRYWCGVPLISKEFTFYLEMPATTHVQNTQNKWNTNLQTSYIGKNQIWSIRFKGYSSTKIHKTKHCTTCTKAFQLITPLE